VGDGTKRIWATAVELWSEPGGLYQGFGLKLARAIPASMIGFTVYEFIKNELTKSDYTNGRILSQVTSLSVPASSSVYFF
jgi:hypothetical protein